MACGLVTGKNIKFKMLSLWYSIDQESHADDQNTLRIPILSHCFRLIYNVIRPESQKGSNMNFIRFLIVTCYLIKFFLAFREKLLITLLQMIFQRGLVLLTKQ
jgi:hypothetical protein